MSLQYARTCIIFFFKFVITGVKPQASSLKKKTNPATIPTLGRMEQSRNGGLICITLEYKLQQLLHLIKTKFLYSDLILGSKMSFFLNLLWSWAWLHNVHSSQVSSMLYLPKRDLDHIQILFWISSNSPTNFQCLWSYNVFSATDQRCKHLKGKGKILPAPRSFFSKLRDPSHMHLCDLASEHF